MKDLFSMMSGMNVSLHSKMDEMQNTLFTLKAEMSAMKADMVTKDTFEKLESRVAALEAMENKGGSSKETFWMQNQMSRLDPANRSLFFRGLLQNDTATRNMILEEYFAGIDAKTSILSIQHHRTGLPGVARYRPI